MTVRGDPPECLLGPVEVRRIAVEKAQAGIGGRDHRGQRLPHLVRHRCRDRVPGQQTCLALATLAEHRAEKLRIQGLISYSRTIRTRLLDRKPNTRTAYQPALKRVGAG